MKHLFVYVNSAIILFAAGLFGYWYLLDGTVISPPIIEKTDTLSLDTDKKVYSAGETVGIFNSFCKTRDVPAMIDVRFVDGMIVSMTSMVRNIPPGCYGNGKPYLVPIARVPNGLSPGVWHIEYTVTIQVNPVKTIVLERRTKDFVIE